MLILPIVIIAKNPWWGTFVRFKLIEVPCAGAVILISWNLNCAKGASQAECLTGGPSTQARFVGDDWIGEEQMRASGS